MMDSKTIEARLLLRESVIGGISVSRCLSKYRSLTGSIEKGDNEALRRDVAAFVTDVMLYELETSKAWKSFNTYVEQISAYLKQEEEIASRLVEAQVHIGELEEELRQQQRIRTHREELEVRSADVVTLPNRKILKRRIEEVEGATMDINNALDGCDAKIGLKFRQFQAMLVSIAELQAKIIEDEESLPQEQAEDELGEDDLNRDDDRDDNNRRGKDTEEVEADANNNHGGEDDSMKEDECQEVASQLGTEQTDAASCEQNFNEEESLML